MPGWGHLTSQRGHCTSAGTKFIVPVHFIQLLSLVERDVRQATYPFSITRALTWQVARN